MTAAKNRKLTPWFPYGTRPSREGWYEVKSHFEGPSYRYWDGARWSYTYGAAYVERHPVAFDLGAYRRSTWRGLVTNPATGAAQ